MSAIKSSAVRYALASLLALVSDFAITLGLFQIAGLSLTASSAISFILVGIGFYFIHEFWSFRRAGSAFSFRRLQHNFIILCFAFIARVATIATLEAVHPPGLWLGMAYFGVGAGLSFGVNYSCNRIFVFRGPNP